LKVEFALDFASSADDGGEPGANRLAEAMRESTAVLEVRGVSKRFDAVVALKSADLSVRAGEVHALMGSNGAGKSTLVKILTGVYPADGGIITVRGEQRAFRSPLDARRGGIVSVYQDPALVPDLTVGQNLRLAKVSNNLVRGWLKELGVGGLDFNTTVRDLPYPVLRLIDLGRALASEPTILLLDEITAALPADLSERVFTIVRHWRDSGNAVIFISHRMAEVSALCDRTTVLRDGVTVGVTQTARGSEDRIVSLMLGRETTHGQVEAQLKSPVVSSASNHPPALEVRDLFCGHMVKGVSFSLRAGEVLGIAALDGQGQQELFDCIAGVRRFDKGSIRADGRVLKLRHPADAIRAGLVLVPANRLQALLSQRSIRENVGLPAFRRISRWGPIPARAERGRVESAVKRLHIDTRAESQLSRLSGGNQQKVVIARWLANGFKTLLCFDPTRGIDIGTKQQIYALVRDLANAGSAVLLFTSELTEIAIVCDRALVLFGGQIVHEMPAADADEGTLLRAAHGLAPRAEANS
jgi:ribose transport system ATP-binding protein